MAVTNTPQWQWKSSKLRVKMAIWCSLLPAAAATCGVRTASVRIPGDDRHTVRTDMVIMLSGCIAESALRVAESLFPTAYWTLLWMTATWHSGEPWRSRKYLGSFFYFLQLDWIKR